VEDVDGGAGEGRAGSCLLSSAGESIGDGSSCWSDIKVSCDAVDARWSIVKVV